MRQNIFILGATGNVGRELVSQIATHDVPELGIHENPTAVVGLADRRGIVMNEGGFSRDVLEVFSQNRQRVSEVIGRHEEENVWRQTLDLTSELGFDGEVVFVDVTAANEEAKDFHLQVINGGGKIVTANKNPISRFSVEAYRRLTVDPKRYGYSATTMAGLGAVPWISERVTLGETIEAMTASLSGTVGYITDRLTKGEKLSAAIQEARKYGYTEPDFRDDLNGIDVARKLVILAREAGCIVDMEKITIDPFLPKDFFDIGDPETCLREIQKRLDRDMTKKYAEARKRGKTFKYLAFFQRRNGGLALKIRLAEVPLESAFGRLSGTDNRIEIVTDRYSKKRPYKLEGPGAGLDITASVIRRDLVHLQPWVHR